MPEADKSSEQLEVISATQNPLARGLNNWATAYCVFMMLFSFAVIYGSIAIIWMKAQQRYWGVRYPDYEAFIYVIGVGVLVIYTVLFILGRSAVLKSAISSVLYKRVGLVTYILAALAACFFVFRRSM